MAVPVERVVAETGGVMAEVERQAGLPVGGGREEVAAKEGGGGVTLVRTLTAAWLLAAPALVETLATTATTDGLTRPSRPGQCGSCPMRVAPRSSSCACRALAFTTRACFARTGTWLSASLLLAA